MGTCRFLVLSFCRVRGLRTDACARGMGAWICWVPRGGTLDSAICRYCGRRRKSRGRCCGSAAQNVVAEIGSSKLIAGVFTVSANSPRYRGCCGCRARRAAPAQVPGVAAVSEFAVVSSRGFLSTTGIDLRNLIFLGGLLHNPHRKAPEPYFGSEYADTPPIPCCDGRRNMQ